MSNTLGLIAAIRKRVGQLPGMLAQKRWLVLVTRIFTQSLREFLTDNCPHLAAGISYYFLMSLFPLSLALISAAGFVLKSSNVEEQIIHYISTLFPAAGDFVADTIHGVAQTWTATGILALIGLLWTGLGVFNAVRKAINTAWGIRQPRPFFRERLLEIGMVTGMAFLLLISFGLATALNIMTELRAPFLSGTVIRYFPSVGGSILLSFLAFLFLYKFVPNTRVRWGAVWPGAMAAALAFVALNELFIFFVSSFARYNLVYGSLGALVGLMTWIYLSAIIVLFCAKIISVYPKVKYSPSPRPETGSGY